MGDLLKKLQKARISEAVGASVYHNFLKPGKYYIGDICYVLRDDIYDDVWGKKYEYNDGVYKVEGIEFAVAGTAYGDGTYEGSDGREYSVDAGVIGVVPEKLWKEDISNAPELGRIVDVKNKLSFHARDGIFTIHLDGIRIVINTKE